jgi:hypothetical protein
MPQLPSILSIAAPNDAVQLAEWESHLLLLQRAGRLTCWSPAHLIAGTMRDENITRHLESATIIVLLISSAFFASDECYHLMQRALQRANNGHTIVVPLLLRSVAWRDTPLSELHCLPSNGRPVANWPHSDDAFQDCIEEIKRLLSQYANAASINIGQSGVHVHQQSQMSAATSYHSCFLSYAHQDEPLAQRLHADLQARGVQCWFASRDMKIGAKIRPTLDQAIEKQGKFLLILSEHALTSAWIEDEVEAALEYERRQQREMLFPIRLDNEVMQTSQAWAAKLRRTCNIGDFTHWTEPEQYEQAFERLLSDLQKAEK